MNKKEPKCSPSIKDRESLTKISKQGNCQDIHCMECYISKLGCSFIILDDCIQNEELQNLANKILYARRR